MKTLLDLANDMDRLADRIPLAVNEIKMQVVEKVHTDLVTVTPVDTTKALSNWVVSNEEPFDLDLDAYREGSQGSTYNASVSEALAQGRRAVLEARPGISVFISNNAPYIRDLDNGSSNQNPGGFVSRSVLLGRKLVSKLRLKL